MDAVVKITHVGSTPKQKTYRLQDFEDVKNDKDRQHFENLISTQCVIEVENTCVMFIFFIFLAFDTYHSYNKKPKVFKNMRNRNYETLRDELLTYEPDQGVIDLLRKFCENDYTFDYNNISDSIRYIDSISPRFKFSIYGLSKKGHKRTNVDSFRKLETYTIFDVLYKTTTINTSSEVRLIPCNMVLLRISGELKGFIISDIRYTLYHMTSKNHYSYSHVCPLCEYRFARHTYKRMTEHMLRCNGKSLPRLVFDEKCLTHKPASLTTIKPPFIICGDFETIRENKTMSVISCALNLMFLDIDTGIYDTNFKTQRYSFTIVYDYISYKSPFASLPVELRMFINDDLQKLRNDMVQKVENKEIELGGLALIDIFILDIMARNFVKRFYYLNRDLKYVLKKSDKTRDYYINYYKTNNHRCYQCNLPIDYNYEKGVNQTLVSFKAIFRKYIFKEFANTVSLYKSYTKSYDAIFEEYMSILTSLKKEINRTDGETTNTDEVNKLRDRFEDFNNMYKLQISFETFKEHVGYLSNYCVLHHHPFSGRILGPSHRICNLSQEITLYNLKTDIYFHNIGFDSLFFLNQMIPEIIEFFGEREISMIFNGSKLKYMFSENFSFKDSYSIFQCAASTLFSTFSKDNREEIVQQCFLNLYSTFDDDMKEFGFFSLFEDFKIMCEGKGIALYDNVCKEVYESATPFPSKHMYRSSLKEFSESSDIDELYEVFRNIYYKYMFNLKKFGLLDFNNFYNMLDAELLAHAIKMICKTEESGKIYTVRHTSIPTSARSLIVYSSNVILRYIPSQVVYDIFRTTKIGGYSGVHVPISYNTEVYKTLFQTKSLGYSTAQVLVDACSLYPATMVDSDYPTGPYKHVSLNEGMNSDSGIVYLQGIIDSYEADGVILDILVNYDIEFTHTDKFYTYTPVVVKQEIPLYFLSSYQRLMCRKRLRSGKYVYSGTKSESVFPACFKHNKWGYFNQMQKEIELEYTVTNIKNYILMVSGPFLRDEINKIVKIRQDPDVKPAVSMMAKLKANSASGVFGMESERKQKTKVLCDPVLNENKKAKVSDIKDYFSEFSKDDDVVVEAIEDNKKRKTMGVHYCTKYDNVPFDERVDNRIMQKNVKRMKLWNDCADNSVFKGFVEEVPLSRKVKSLIPINSKILNESKIRVGLFYKRIFDDFKSLGITMFNCYTDTDSLKMMFHKDDDSDGDEFLNMVLNRFKINYSDIIDFSNIKNHPHYDGRFKKHLGFWQHENGGNSGYIKVKSIVATSPKSYHVTYCDDSIERKAKGIKAAIDIPVKHYLDNFVDVSCYYDNVTNSTENVSVSDKKDLDPYEKVQLEQKNMKTNEIVQHQFKNSLTSNIKIQEIKKKTFASITNKTYRLGKRGELTIIHGHPVLKNIISYLKTLNSEDLFTDETIKTQYQMEQEMINNSEYLKKWTKFFSQYTSSFIEYHTRDENDAIRLSKRHTAELDSDDEL